jgi:hypothetical protein
MWLVMIMNFSNICAVKNIGIKNRRLIAAIFLLYYFSAFEGVPKRYFVGKLETGSGWRAAS